MPRTLDAYYHESRPRTPFTTAFLSDANLRRLRQEVLREVETIMGDHPIPTHIRETTDGFFMQPVLTRILREAELSCEAPAELVPNANALIRPDLVASVASEALAFRSYDRWLTDGHPNLANVPRPAQPQRRDTTILVDSYALSHPYGSGMAGRTAAACDRWEEED